jgi:lauroyl/myristoyl acyltransferase
MERMVLGSLRLLERALPPLLLRWLLWPAAALWSAWELAHREPTLELFRRLPPSLRPAWPQVLWPVRFWRRRCRLNLTRCLEAWPDRLHEPRWQKRCRLDGFERFERIWGTGRAVVLVGLHFGPVTVFYHWLRARGVPAAALVSRNLRGPLTYRRCLGRRADRIHCIEAVPRAFELGQLNEAVEFLCSPGVLINLADGGQGRELLIQGEEYNLSLSPGAFRLAALARAAVIPCLTSADPGMGFTIHLGEPVPDDYVTDRRRHEAACAWLLHSFSAVLRKYPEQCSSELLHQFQRRPQIGPEGTEQS